jgi:hypothetical protein
MDSIATDKDGNLCVAYREHTPDFQDIWGEVKCLYGKEWVRLGGKIGKGRIVGWTHLFVDGDGGIYLTALEYPYLHAPVWEASIRVYKFDGEWDQVGGDIVSPFGLAQWAFMTLTPGGEIYVVGGSYFSREVWRNLYGEWEMIDYEYVGGYMYPHYGIVSDSYNNIYLYAPHPLRPGRIRMWDGKEWMDIGDVYRTEKKAVGMVSLGISPDNVLYAGYSEGNALYVDIYTFNGWAHMGGALNSSLDFQAQITSPVGAIGFEPYNQIPYVAFRENRGDMGWWIILKHFNFCLDDWETDLDILASGIPIAPLLAINKTGHLFIAWWETGGGIKIKRSTIPLPEEAPTEYGLFCGGDLKVNGELKVNGPLSDIYVLGNVKINGKLILTGNLYYGKNYDVSGEVDITGEPKVISENLPEVPLISFDSLKSKADIIFEENEVYERRKGEFIKVADGVYKDKSGALWRYHSQGPKKKGFWAIQGDYSSTLTGTIYFSTDLKNPDHKITINGTLVVRGELSDSGELHIKTKPDEWALVVGKDAFLRDKTDVWGKIYVGGDIKLTDSECINGCEGEDCDCGEPILPIAKYHDKGKVYVMGDCFINGRFHINNLDLVERVGEYVGRREFGEEFKFIDTLLAGSLIEGEPAVAILIYGNFQKFSDPATVFLNINKFDPSSLRVVVMSDTEDMTPLIFTTDGLPKALFNLPQFEEKYLYEKGEKAEIKEIINIPPHEFYVVMDNGEIYFLNGADVYSIDELAISSTIREERKLGKNEFISTYPQEYKRRKEMLRKEWINYIGGPGACYSILSPLLDNKIKIKESSLPDCCALLVAENFGMEKGVKLINLISAIWNATDSSTKQECTALVGPPGEKCAGLRGIGCIEYLIKTYASGDNIKARFIKDGIMAAALSVFYEICRVCDLPGISSPWDYVGFDSDYLYPACLSFATLFGSCKKSVCDLKGSGCGYQYEEGYKISDECVYELYPRVLTITSKGMYGDSGYNVEAIGEFGWYYWEEDWTRVVNNELIDKFCRGYFTAFSYGYASLGKLNYLSTFLTVRRRCGLDFDTISFYDCYPNICVSTNHVKTNLGEFSETGILSRVYVKPPFPIYPCAYLTWCSPVIGGGGGGEGEGGGGCSYIKDNSSSGFNLLMTLFFIIIPYIIRRKKVC